MTFIHSETFPQRHFEDFHLCALEGLLGVLEPEAKGEASRPGGRPNKEEEEEEDEKKEEEAKEGIADGGFIAGKFPPRKPPGSRN